MPGGTALTEAVARYLFKLMAYKDEYEVARLYTDGAFQKQVAATFEPAAALRYEFHLAPPLSPGAIPTTGVPRKMSFGPWMMTAFGLLAKLKGLRGTALDLFGYSEERRTERRLIADYEAADRRGRWPSSRRRTTRSRRPGVDPGEDPRLRPRQGAPPHRGAGRGGRSAGTAARWLRPGAEDAAGGRVASGLPLQRNPDFSVQPSS